MNWVWWCTPVIPALGRLREDFDFKANLGYTLKSCPQKPKEKNHELSVARKRPAKIYFSKG
jgi:hypothetical protein